jgi:hypothetical protein
LAATAAPVKAFRDDGSFKKAESFEGDAVPANWAAQGGGSLALSPTHYKHGRQSLKWTWDRASALTVTKPQHLEQAGANKRGGMKIWIYNEQAIDGKLTFRFGSSADIEQGDPRYSFELGINFTGWRGMWVQFREDGTNPAYKGDAKSPLEVMEVVPPTGNAQGGVYIDLVEFAESIPASRSTDYQLPYDQIRLKGGIGGTWDRSLMWSEMKPDLPLPASVTAAQAQAFQTIAKRYEDWIYGDQPDLTQEPLKIRYQSLQAFITRGVKQYDQLGIQRDSNGVITGVPLFASRSTHGPEFGEDVARTVFLPLVFDYKLGGHEESKRKVLDLFDYFHDQGWADGSGLETLDHETNRNSGYFHAVYLMRNELKATGRLDRELAAVRWYTNFGKNYAPDPGETTADEMRTKFMYELLYVLALDDSPTKVREMQSLVRWMNDALAIAPGYAGTIKDDYLGFHHRGVYMSAYTPQALHMAALIAYLLHGTEFALSPTSTDHLRNALLTFRVVANKYDVPVGVSGRFPTKDGIANELLPAYAYMALAGDPIDREMAGAFMRLWDPNSSYLRKNVFAAADSTDVSYLDTLGGLQLTLKAAASGVAPESAPQGFWMKPSAALAILRGGDWQVSVKGWSQYAFDFESQAATTAESSQKSQAGQNVYGRYESYGAMQIMAAGSPINKLNNGYALDQGWDWNRWPGATTRHLPWEKLAVSTEHPQTRSFTDETFVGGVMSGLPPSAVDGAKLGVFAMKLHDPVFDPSFRANKSVFFFGNELVALGSGIESGDDGHAVETTLFQSYMGKKDMPIRVNGETVSAFPYSSSGEAGQRTWLMDPYGNGYIIPDAAGLHVERGTQRSPEHSGRKTTSGDYSVAWFGHGIKPDDGGYEYAVLVQASSDQVEKLASAPDYEVLRKDNQAHIVRHQGLGAIGYAVFDSEQQFAFGSLRSVSRPIIAMERATDNGRLTLSVADPDLRLLKFPNQRMDDDQALTPGEAAVVQVALNGRWGFAGGAPDNVKLVGANADSTVFEFTYSGGSTTEIALVKL